MVTSATRFTPNQGLLGGLQLTGMGIDGFGGGLRPIPMDFDGNGHPDFILSFGRPLNGETQNISLPAFLVISLGFDTNPFIADVRPSFLDDLFPSDFGLGEQLLGEYRPQHIGFISSPFRFLYSPISFSGEYLFDSGNQIVLVQSLPSFCGLDGIGIGEDCDDGNPISGDGCSSICQIEDGFQCSSTNLFEVSNCSVVCGDGLVITNTATNETEQCDDTNLSPGDGCSPQCNVEDGFTCSGTPSVCFETSRSLAILFTWFLLKVFFLRPTTNFGAFFDFSFNWSNYMLLCLHNHFDIHCSLQEKKDL